MILITGATGNIGYVLCNLLAIAKIPARAMCREKEQLAQFTKMGLDSVLGDFEDPRLFRQALQGCDRLFLLAPATPKQRHYYKMAIDMAIEANIKHIVKISAAEGNLNSKVAWTKANADADHYLRSKSINWTLIKPTGFMQNFLKSNKAVAKGFLPNATENGKVSYIDIRDIALVAKHILTEDTHNNATYFLTGLEPLSSSEIADKFTSVLGHEVKNVSTTMDEMQSILGHSGIDKWSIESIIAQYQYIKEASTIDVTEEVQRLTGKVPYAFEQFIAEFKTQFIAD